MKLKRFALIAALMGTVALASTIHVWSAGDKVAAADLNANFSHIHGTMVGGHGARLMNADVASNAAISYYKMVSHTGVPKIWAQVECVYSGSWQTCTIVKQASTYSSGLGFSATTTGNPTAGSGVVISPSSGTFNSSIMPRAVFGYQNTGTMPVVCYMKSWSTTQLKVECQQGGGVAISNATIQFFVEVFDYQ